VCRQSGSPAVPAGNGLTGINTEAKDLELRALYANDGIDTQKVSVLETEIKDLKDQINASATKFKIPPCSRS